jgi:hypothetical protein
MSENTENAMPHISREDLSKYLEQRPKNLPELDLNVEIRGMRICRGSPIPLGWIKVNDDWSPTSCGNPSSLTYNVWYIERYDDKPVGSTMRVCSSASTPPGWVDINYDWSPTSCGHPSSITNNVKYIRRVS